MSQHDIVQKLWNLCDILRDDGINYSDYVTELVLLLFIKMVHENQEAGLPEAHPLPEGCRWSDLTGRSGLVLLNHYRHILLMLSTGKDGDKIVHEDPLVMAIYANAQTRLREPRHLEQMIRELDKIDWFSAQKDGLGDLYEGLLEKNANETKSGAGQYFTPRALINTMVRAVKPQVKELIQDPAAGTAGFLIAADQYMKNRSDNYYEFSSDVRQFQQTQAFIGVELVPDTRRLALMNCLLHNISGGKEGAVLLGNSLGDAGKNLPAADLILANPPFGTSKGGEASINRDDLTYDTGNKQLAFLQHIYRNLKPGGRAAVVLPDNVLFEAGKGTDIRRDLMNKCNLHTILRLPTGIFYTQGAKTNVLLFHNGTAANPQQNENCTENIWVYDLRTNMPSFGKRTPFTEAHLAAFEQVFNPEGSETLSSQDLPAVLAARREGEWSHSSHNEGLEHSRWRCFSRQWVAEQKGDSLDISWLKDESSIDSSQLPEPQELARQAQTELAAALAGLEQLLQELEN